MTERLFSTFLQLLSTIEIFVENQIYKIYKVKVDCRRFCRRKELCSARINGCFLHNLQLNSLVAKIRELEGLEDKYNSLKLPKWPNKNNLLAYAYAREAFQGGTK